MKVVGLERVEEHEMLLSVTKLHPFTGLCLPEVPLKLLRVHETACLWGSDNVSSFTKTRH